MSYEKLIIADINNEEHIKLFKEFDKNNNLDDTLSVLKNTDNSDVIIKQILFLKDKESIKDSCFINAEKDKKMCMLDFPNIKKNYKNRELITFAENYSFNTLGMEEIFIQTNPDNDNLISNLEDKQYENLGETDGVITLMKEKELDKEQGRTIHGTR